MSIAVGIDLGTTNTVVGVVRDGRAVTLADEAGRRLIPSVVSFHPSGKVLVGDAAKDRRIVDPTNTIYSVKRLVGRTWGSHEVERSRSSFAFELVEGPKQGVAVVARGETYTLPEISAFVLRRAKQIAETVLGEVVDRAVITVPANFNDPQRAATKLAGKLAGLEVLRILNEPTAAALAYGQGGGPGRQHERVAVYDLGGGTFDITLLDLSGNVFEVLATGGDTALGGDDVDQVIVERMSIHILQNHRVDPRADPTARAILRERAEVLKQELSSRQEATTKLDDVVRGQGGDFIPISFTMKRGELEALSSPLIERTLETCRFSIETAGLKLGEINRVILVGGATRMPLVARRVEQFFQRPATGRVNPDEVVALGAAIQAAALGRGSRAKLKTAENVAEPAASAARQPVAAPAPSHARQPVAVVATPPSVLPPPIVPELAAPPSPPPPSAVVKAPAPPPERTGSRQTWDAKVSGSEAFVIERTGRGLDFQLDLPAAREMTAPSPSKVAPVRAASPPAPVKEASPVPAPPPHQVIELQQPMPPQRPPPLLIDVTPISLGVEVVGGFTDMLIAANTPVPCDKTRVFRTASDDQTTVVVRVGQGESPKFSENTTLGDLELSGLTPAARGDVKIAVTFEIDADGILNVRAKDVDSGRETVAKMNLLGTQTDAAEVSEMLTRQQQHAVE